MSAERPHLFPEDFDPEAAERFHRRIAPVLAAATVALVVAIGAVAFAVAQGRDLPRSVNATELRLSPSQAHGRRLFGRTCATCHTLAAANAVGKVGPNLDLLAPDGLPETFVADTIAAGMVRGNGTMPAGLLTGGDAADVASFLAAVTQDAAADRP